MIIRHDSSTLNTYNSFRATQHRQTEATAKLASGLRVIKAADDAASLSISEGMRAQLRGIGQASRNTQDAMSLLNTAQGSLQEIQGNLQRIRELSVQAASDSHSAADRVAANDEVQALKHNIQSVLKTAEYNTISLLTGISSETAPSQRSTEKSTTLQIDTVQTAYLGHAGNSAMSLPTSRGTFSVTASTNVNTNDLNGLVISLAIGTGSASYSRSQRILTVPLEGISGYSFTADQLRSLLTQIQNKTNTWLSNQSEGIRRDARISVTSNLPQTGTFAITAYPAPMRFDNSGQDALPAIYEFSVPQLTTGDRLEIDSTTIEVVSVGPSGNQISTELSQMTELAALLQSKGTFLAEASGRTLRLTQRVPGVGAVNSGTVFQTEVVNDPIQPRSPRLLNLQIGANLGQQFQLQLNDIETAMQADLLAMTVANRDAATATLDHADHAISLISSERSRLGAYYNQLEHTTEYLLTAGYNLTSAESQIRDADIAKTSLMSAKDRLISEVAIVASKLHYQSRHRIFDLLVTTNLPEFSLDAKPQASVFEPASAN